MNLLGNSYAICCWLRMLSYTGCAHHPMFATDLALTNTEPLTPSGILTLSLL